MSSVALATPVSTSNGSGSVTLLEIETVRVSLTLKGTSPLIVHKWSKKAKQEMLDKQMKKATKGREAKDPERDFRDSLYVINEDDVLKGAEPIYGFPSVGFKAAAVRAGTYCELKMTYLRGAFHVEGEFVTIDGSPTMREDMVRVGMGTADIRHRGEFKEWTAKLPVVFNRRAITVDQIVNLFNIAGFAVGIGEWRPEKDGPYGRFEVVS